MHCIDNCLASLLLIIYKENQLSTVRIVCCMLMSIIGTCRQMLMNICIELCWHVWLMVLLFCILDIFLPLVWCGGLLSIHAFFWTPHLKCKIQDPYSLLARGVSGLGCHTRIVEFTDVSPDTQPTLGPPMQPGSYGWGCPYDCICYYSAGMLDSCLCDARMIWSDLTFKVRHPKKKTDARIDNNPPHQSKKTKNAKNNNNAK